MKEKIRSIPDFPKKGILFRDITTLIKDKDAFTELIDTLANRFDGKRIDVVASIEARGFIIGGALAYRLGAGMVPIRKEGKLPWETHTASYDLEYGKDTLEIHRDAVQKEDNVLIVDDLLATGGTSSAAVSLVEQLGGRIVELVFLIELTELKGKEKLPGYPVFSLIKY
jgi:adenine phosphoribosyltransferase